MRKSEKEIVDKALIEDVIHQSLVCRLGLTDGPQPYIVPLCFGYDDGALYFHSALEGRKLDVIRRNDRVCFEFDANVAIGEGESACKWSMRYQSVIGFGRASLLDDIEEKREALGIIVRQYSDRSCSFPDASLDRVAVIKVAIETMTGKQTDY